MLNPAAFSVILIRRLDGKPEPSFAYRACAVRGSVAELLVKCEVAGIAWLDSFSNYGEADIFLREVKKCL